MNVVKMARSTLAALVCCFLMCALACGGTTRSTAISADDEAASTSSNLDLVPREAASPEVISSGDILTGTHSRTDSDSQSQVLTIAASGDLLLHIKVNLSARQHGWDHSFSQLAPLLPEHHLAVANLETPLVDDERPVISASPPTLGATEGAAEALANAGFDVLACANNHAFDQGGRGLVRTIERVRDASMVPVGAVEPGGDPLEATVIEWEGWRVAMLGVSELMNRGPRRREPQARVGFMGDPRLIEAIERARPNADLVVLLVHWSYDYAFRIAARHRRLAHHWVEAGVDFVVGTGPHVLQRVELLESPRGDAVIAYSLGNLISNQGQRWQPGRRLSEEAHPALRLVETRDGVLLRAAFSKVDDRLNVSLTGVPLFTENNFWEWHSNRSIGHNIRVVPLSGADEAVRQLRRDAIAEVLGPDVTIVDR